MNEQPVFTRIRQEITENPVVLFMKGTPMFPQCGFSAAVVQALTNMGVKFKGIDVLTDPGLREGIKQFTNWPTIPQLYVGGEFVGGCDIVREMYETGELQELLEQKGVAYAAEPAISGLRARRESLRVLGQLRTKGVRGHPE